MNFDPQQLKVAIVADWLTSRGGAERVILALAELFPGADLFTTVYKAENFPELAHRRVFTSYLQGWPLRFKHQLFPTLRPQAIESLNLDSYDLVISSSSAEAKGVITKPETLHVCYCHTPTRYYWSHYHEYLQRSEYGLLDKLIKLIVPSLIHRLRVWDQAASGRVDFFIANSRTTQARIAKYYRRESVVVHPPVDVARFAEIPPEAGDFYLVLGRQIAYKRTDLVVEAFNQLQGKRLVVIGDGPELARLKSLATAGNVEFLGNLSDAEVAEYLARCRALIFPQEEDFGIVPLEAMAAGKPVIAYGKGGATDSVIPGTTGILFDAQTPASLIDALHAFEASDFDTAAIRAHAASFGLDRFGAKLLATIEQAWQQHRNNLGL